MPSEPRADSIVEPDAEAATNGAGRSSIRSRPLGLNVVVEAIEGGARTNDHPDRGRLEEQRAAKMAVGNPIILVILAVPTTMMIQKALP